jgi:hypothetical protein
VAEPLPDRPSEGHPIVTGLVALVGVTVAVGLILGFVVLAGSRVLGIGGDDGGTGSSSERSMYLPRPEKTPTESGPLVSLQPGESAGSSESSSTDEPTESESPKFAISLSAGQVSVGPMERIDLTGTYPGGEGAILQVERFIAGSWTEFQVTASVSDETFSTYVQTGQTGINKFRVRDTDTGVRSNAITVTVG